MLATFQIPLSSEFYGLHFVTGNSMEMRPKFVINKICKCNKMHKKCPFPQPLKYSCRILLVT